MNTTDHHRITAWLSRHGIDGGADPVGVLLVRAEAGLIAQAKQRAAMRQPTADRVWTPEAVATLVELCGTAATYEQIAKRLGLTTSQVRTKARALQRRGQIEKRKPGIKTDAR